MTDKTWDVMFDRLMNYKNQHGNCEVPQKYMGDPQLGRWVRKQRQKRDKMSEERKARLEEIGFQWSGLAFQKKMQCNAKKM